MIKKLFKLLPHIIALSTLSLVESIRLNIFLKTIVLNQYASFVLAITMLLLVFYFAYNKLNDLSKYSAIACCIISILSYAEPIKSEFQKAVLIEKKALVPIPELELEGKYWNERKAIIDNHKAKVELVQIQNKAIKDYNDKLESRGLDYYGLLSLVFTALLFSLFVPLAVYRISHLLSDILRVEKDDENHEIETIEDNPKAELKANVLAKVLAGYSVTSISQECNVSRNTIYVWIKEAGIQTRPYGRNKLENKHPNNSNFAISEANT